MMHFQPPYYQASSTTSEWQIKRYMTYPKREISVNWPKNNVVPKVIYLHGCKVGASYVLLWWMVHEKVGEALNISTKWTNTKKQWPQKLYPNNLSRNLLSDRSMQGYFGWFSTVEAKCPGYEIDKKRIIFVYRCQRSEPKCMYITITMFSSNECYFF